MGDTTTHDLLVRRLALGVGAVVIFVDYDRSPEAKYPVAIEQDYAVTEYIAKHGDEFGVDARRLAIGGDSVGGNMTAVVALLAKERKGPDLKAQLLFYPVTDAAMKDGSFQEFTNGPWLTTKAMEFFWNAYEPDAAKRAARLALLARMRDVHLSPLNATAEQLKGQPPALIITAENDVLRDEGEAYARKLTEAGVRSVVTRYNATIHDFVMLNALATAPAAEAAVAQTRGFLRETLSSH